MQEVIHIDKSQSDLIQVLIIFLLIYYLTNYKLTRYFLVLICQVYKKNDFKDELHFSTHSNHSQ